MSWNIAKPGDQINGPVAVTGNLNVDSNTLFVDSANNRVGVLTASPTVPLDVVGDAKVSGNLTVDTNTLVVDAANNRLGIGISTFTGTQPLQVLSAIRVSDANPEASNGLNIAVSATTATVETRYGTPVILGTNATERLRIASDGVCTWSNVGGVAGERMKLDVGGLGIGVAPTNTANARRLDIGGSLGAYLTLSSTSSSANARNWSVGANVNAYGDFAINQSNAKDGDPLAAGTTRLAIDLNGNVGIGTMTPAATLTVNTSSSAGSAYISSDSTGGSFRSSGNLQFYTDNAAYSIDWFSANKGSLKMRLTNDGNLGLGVTPKSWASIFRVQQVGNGAFFAGRTDLANQLQTGTNCYYDSTDNRWEYISNAKATRYYQFDGAHTWETAAAAAADTAITFTQAMTLDASGRLLIGGTSTYDFAGQANLVVNGTSNNATLTIASTGAGYLAFADGTTGTSRYVGRIDYDHGTDQMALTANAVERLLIKKNGQVNFVGLASDPAGAAAGDVYYNTTTNKLKCYNGTTWNDLF